jgi:hypothetical protein
MGERLSTLLMRNYATQVTADEADLLTFVVACAPAACLRWSAITSSHPSADSDRPIHVADVWRNTFCSLVRTDQSESQPWENWLTARHSDYRLSILVYHAAAFDSADEVSELISGQARRNWSVAHASLPSDSSAPFEGTCGSGQWVKLRVKDITTRLSTAAEISEDETVELVYDQLYRFTNEPGGFNVIDALLSVLNPRRFKNSVVLSILTATGIDGVRDHLPSRAAFFEKAKSWLSEREGQKEAEELLSGLE